MNSLIACFLLVDFLYYAVGIGLSDYAYQYLWFVLILLLLCLFGIVWLQGQCCFVGKDGDNLQQLLFSFHVMGAASFVIMFIPC